MAALGTDMGPPGWEFLSEYAEQVFGGGLLIAIAGVVGLILSSARGGWLLLRLLPDPRFYGNPQLVAKDSLADSTTESQPPDEIDVLARLLIEHHGEDAARDTLRRALENQSGAEAGGADEVVPAPVVTRRIRLEPNRSTQHLQRLGFADISRLAQKLLEPSSQLAEASRAAQASLAEAARRAHLDMGEAYRQQVPDFGELARQQIPNLRDLAKQQIPNFSDLAKEADPKISDLFDEDED